jgi:hypothetical protein
VAEESGMAAPKRHLQKPRLGINDILVLSKCRYARGLGCDKAVMRRMSVYISAAGPKVRRTVSSVRCSRRPNDEAPIRERGHINGCLGGTKAA